MSRDSDGYHSILNPTISGVSPLSKLGKDENRWGQLGEVPLFCTAWSGQLDLHVRNKDSRREEP